jgi:hypothetical protein
MALRGGHGSAWRATTARRPYGMAFAVPFRAIRGSALINTKQYIHLHGCCGVL